MWSATSCKYKPGNKSDSVGHIRGRGGIIVSIIDTYPLSSVKRIFNDYQQTQDVVNKIYEGMTSTSALGTLCLMVSLRAAFLYQGHHERINKLEISFQLGELLECCYIEMESLQLGS